MLARCNALSIYIPTGLSKRISALTLNRLSLHRYFPNQQTSLTLCTEKPGTKTTLSPEREFDVHGAWLHVYVICSKSQLTCAVPSHVFLRDLRPWRLVMAHKVRYPGNPSRQGKKAPTDKPLPCLFAINQFDDGDDLMQWCEKFKLEGVVSKKRDAPYVSGECKPG